MKNYMQIVILLLVSSIYLPSCCQDHEDDELGDCSEEAVIIDFDYRECACCGGWFIEIGQDTLRAKVLPQEFTDSLTLNEAPLPVYLEWEPEDNPCLGDEIEVDCIRRQS